MSKMSKLRRNFIAVLAVLLCAMLCISAAFLIPKNEKAIALTSPNSNLNVGELILDDYKTRADGKMFNGASMQKLYKNLTGNSGATYADVQALAAGKLTAQQIRSNAYGGTVGLTDTNGEFTVKFGGKDWIPAYLSTAGDNVILTLWLAESSEVSQWNEWTANNTSYQYPSNLYSTSKIRSYLVGSQYIPKGSNTSTPASSLSTTGVQNSGWKDFIDKYEDYIVTPSAVEWQEHETSRKDLIGIGSQATFSNGYNLDFPNDSWGAPGASHPNNPVVGDSWFSDTSINMEQVYNATDNNGTRIYGAWQNDKIWLPSLTETGDVTSFNGMWRLSSNQQINSNGAFLRSSWFMTATDVVYLSYRGDGNHYNTSITNSYTVRPAFHLNLTAVSGKTTSALTVPENIEVTYNGDEQSVTALGDDGQLSWYDQDLYSEGIEITYKSGTTTYNAEDVIDAKTYTVTLTAPDTSGKTWADVNNSVGSSATKTITLTIKKKKITVSLSLGDDGLPKAKISNPDEISDHDATEELSAVEAVEAKLRFTYKNKAGTPDYDSKTPPTTPGDYIATVYIEECNYTIDTEKTKTTEIEFKINKKSGDFNPDKDIQWVYVNNGNTVEIDTSELVGGYYQVPYNGKDYTIKIKDELLIGKGVIVSTYSDRTGLDVGKHEAKVILEASSDDYADPEEDTFTLKWEIIEAKYDLSKIEWDYEDGSLVYNQSAQTVKVKSGSVPAGLTVSGYKDNTKTNAGEYEASITGFTNSNNNYKTPNPADPSTYEGTLATLKWKIEKKPLEVEWLSAENKNYKDEQSQEYFWLPEATNNENDRFEVKYYKENDFDMLARRPKEGAVPVDPKDMHVSHDDPETYYAVAFVTSLFEDNYQIDLDTGYMLFVVGDNKIVAQLTLDEKFTFDGEGHGTLDEVKIKIASDTFDKSYLSVKWYQYSEGAENHLGTNLPTAPVNVGKYVAVFAILSDHEELFTIDGSGIYEFEIKTLVLEVPEYDGQLTYDGDEHDVAELFKLPEGWENYLEISIKSNTYGVANPTNGKIKKAAEYTVTFTIKKDINDGLTTNNVEWKVDTGKTTSKSADIKIDKLILHAAAWEADGYDSYISFEENNAKKFVVYTVYDADGKVVDKATVEKTLGESFVVEVTVGEEHFGSVEIEFAAGISSQYEFFTDGGMPPLQVTVPTIEDLTFNGENQTFVVDYGGYEDYIEIDTTQSDPLTQCNAGEYKIYFKIKRGQNAVWVDSDGNRGSILVTFKMNALILDDPEVKEGEKFTYNGSEQAATLNIDAAILLRFMKIEGDYKATNAGDYSFTLSIDSSFAGNVVWASGAQNKKSVSWTIEKAKITVKWTDDDVPELDLPEEFKDLDIEYEIRDENGKKVSKDELEPGKKYTITATLSDGSSANYEFVDDSGTALTTSSTDGHGFEIKKNGSSFPWWIIALVVGLLLVAAAVIVVVVKRRQAADGEDEYDDFYDDEYDFDEEEEIEEDGGDFGDDDF